MHRCIRWLPPPEHTGAAQLGHRCSAARAPVPHSMSIDAPHHGHRCSVARASMLHSTSTGAPRPVLRSAGSHDATSPRQRAAFWVRIPQSVWGRSVHPEFRACNHNRSPSYRNLFEVKEKKNNLFTINHCANHPPLSNSQRSCREGEREYVGVRGEPCVWIFEVVFRADCVVFVPEACN